MHARLSLHMSKCHIVGNHMSRLICLAVFNFKCRDQCEVYQTVLIIDRFCVGFLFCNEVFSLISSFAIILLRKREWMALLKLCNGCRVTVCAIGSVKRK